MGARLSTSGVSAVISGVGVRDRCVLAMEALAGHAVRAGRDRAGIQGKRFGEVAKTVDIPGCYERGRFR